MFNKEKRERDKAVRAELKDKMKPRPTYAMRMEKKGRTEKREAKEQARHDTVAGRLKELHAGGGTGDVAQLGSDLLYLTALSGLQLQIQDQLSTEERCFTRWTVYGRHDKEFLGMAPTDRDVQFGGVSVSFLADEQVSQEFHYWDMVALLQQIQAP